MARGLTRMRLIYAGCVPKEAVRRRDGPPRRLYEAVGFRKLSNLVGPQRLRPASVVKI